MPMFHFANGNSNAPGILARYRHATKWMALLFFCLVVPGVCEANQRDQALEKEILKQLEMAAPEAVTFFISATEAMDAGNNEVALQSYKRVLEYVPNFVPALRRMS